MQAKLTTVRKRAELASAILAKKLKECGVSELASADYLNNAMVNRREWKLHGEDIVKSYVAEIKAAETPIPKASLAHSSISNLDSYTSSSSDSSSDDSDSSSESDDDSESSDSDSDEEEKKEETKPHISKSQEIQMLKEKIKMLENERKSQVAPKKKPKKEPKSTKSKTDKKSSKEPNKIERSLTRRRSAPAPLVKSVSSKPKSKPEHKSKDDDDSKKSNQSEEVRRRFDYRTKSGSSTKDEVVKPSDKKKKLSASKSGAPGSSSSKHDTPPVPETGQKVKKTRSKSLDTGSDHYRREDVKEKSKTRKNNKPHKTKETAAK